MITVCTCAAVLFLAMVIACSFADSDPFEDWMFDYGNQAKVKEANGHENQTARIANAHRAEFENFEAHERETK